MTASNPSAFENPQNDSAAMFRRLMRPLAIVGATAVASVLLYYALPGDMNELARRTCCIFLVATVFWATEVLPLFATSLCILAMELVFLSSKGGLAMKLPALSDFPIDQATGKLIQMTDKDVFSPFASPTILLFMGGFLLSAAVTKHGLDRVIAAKLLRPFTKNPIVLIYAVLGISGFFSMWMSNTATAAMMIAIIAPLLAKLPKDDRFHRAVILAVPFGANIGGVGTPIGTPPNAIALDTMRANGISISFLDWMLVAVPLAILLLLVTGVLLYRFFPPKADLKMPTLEKSSRIDWQGRLTLLILLAAIAMWLTGKLHGIHPAGVALFAGATLTALRVLGRHDVDSIDWNVLILMWGGLSLGGAMQDSKLVEYIVALPFVSTFTSVPGLFGAVLLAVFVALLAVTLSTFMSNTAAAALIIPMAMALSPANKGELAILTALACSFAMAMPVSTPPNAIAFATGDVPVGSMIRSGGLISIIAVVVLLAGYHLIIPLFLPHL